MFGLCKCDNHKTPEIRQFSTLVMFSVACLRAGLSAFVFRVCKEAKSYNDGYKKT